MVGPSTTVGVPHAMCLCRVTIVVSLGVSRFGSVVVPGLGMAIGGVLDSCPGR